MKKDLHQQTPPQISIDAIWDRQDVTIIDVRSPNEFEAGTIPGAQNIPLLTDIERSLIGTLYRQYGQQPAIEKGYKLFEPKISTFLDQFNQLPKDKILAVFCARGGLRSQVITSFLCTQGYTAMQMIGGYKDFRIWNLEKLDQFTLNHPVILHGKTGVGKTLVLYQLDNTLDLEGLAQHRGSMFGAIGKRPVSQKSFDAALLKRLEALDNTRPVFIEGESRKIGNISLPAKLFGQMKTGRAILLEASISKRALRTVTEYINKNPDSLREIRETILKLTRDLGTKNVQNLITDFDEQKYQSCFEYILLNYYDRKYNFSMKSIQFETTISAEDIKQAAKDITTYFSPAQTVHL
ncbi:tRNA 2-selenouridine(34) synthase MnmH [bacterium]|nr:tRNA 2-selenouridine(34) synthase MnmH [bacterium]